MKLTLEEHQEIAHLIDEMEPSFVGHSRTIIIYASIKIIAAMLGPAKLETREIVYKEIGNDIKNLVDHIDKQMSLS